MKKAVKDYVNNHKGSNLALIFEAYGNKTLNSLLPNLKVKIKDDVPMAEFYGAVKNKGKHNEENLVKAFLLRVYENKAEYVVFKEYETDIEWALEYYRKDYGDNEWAEIEMTNCETVEEVASLINDIAEAKWGKFDSERQKNINKLSFAEKIIAIIVMPIIVFILFAMTNDIYYDEDIIGVIIWIGVASISTYVSRSRKFKKYIAKRDLNNH